MARTKGKKDWPPCLSPTPNAPYGVITEPMLKSPAMKALVKKSPASVLLYILAQEQRHFAISHADRTGATKDAKAFPIDTPQASDMGVTADCFYLNMKLAKDRGIFTSKSGLQGGIKALIALGFMDKVATLRPVYGMTYGVYRLSHRWCTLTEAEIKKALEVIKRSS